MADFAILESQKLIWRKIWVMGKLWNFHTVLRQLPVKYIPNVTVRGREDTFWIIIIDWRRLPIFHVNFISLRSTFSTFYGNIWTYCHIIHVISIHNKKEQFLFSCLKKKIEIFSFELFPRKMWLIYALCVGKPQGSKNSTKINLFKSLESISPNFSFGTYGPKFKKSRRILKISPPLKSCKLNKIPLKSSYLLVC